MHIVQIIAPGSWNSASGNITDENSYNNNIQWNSNKPSWQQLLDAWPDFASGYGGVIKSENLIFTPSSWSETKKIRVNYANGQVPGYVDLKSVTMT